MKNTDQNKSNLAINDSSATLYYEDWVAREPDCIEAFAYLGLVYLVNGEEEAAQLTWLGGLSQLPEHNLLESTNTLVKILQSEAIGHAENNMLKTSQLIRLHIHEIQPDNLENILSYIHNSIILEDFDPILLEEWQIIEVLENSEIEPQTSILSQILAEILCFPSQQSLDFAEACLNHFQSLENWINLLVESAQKIDFELKYGFFAASIIELCLKYDPENSFALSHLPNFYANCDHYKEAILSAEKFYTISNDLETQFISNCLLLQSLMKAGAWNEMVVVIERHKLLLKQLIQSDSTQLKLNTIQFLITYSGALSYLQDNLAENRWFQNNAGKLFLKNLQANAPQSITPSRSSSEKSRQRIRIGYIGTTLRNHSVGWLCRWLFKYHDKSLFEIYVYLVEQKSDNKFFQTWFAPYIEKCTTFNKDIEEAVEIIRNDELDILVDLDSYTLRFTTTVMAFKPAPIQVTWLGCDASGIPGIDYFIADPYVLTEDAQDHYNEKIFRLKDTYIAVEGFETDLPTIRRSDLGISEDAIVYISSQSNFKRDLKTLRLQLKIIKTVPNSYFLLKGSNDQDLFKELVFIFAEEEKVELEKIYFLPPVLNEYQHRANLEIADVALDTYPYNGATTTLETLWMGIPLVTRVGEQFAARNSYAFLQNVGVTEGIAWTDEEYVEWGIRLGCDEALRRQVAWTLRQSRKTSPLWNAKQFTLEMEKAYCAMCNRDKIASLK